MLVVEFPGPAMPRSKSTADPSIANLHTAGEHLKIFSLQNLLTNKRSRETRAAARLGEVLLPWYEKTVARPGQKLEGISGLWQAHVPKPLLDHCRLVGFHRGTLTVALDSATVRAELDAKLRSGLLGLLQRESRGGLYRVKTCVQGLGAPG